MDKKLHDARVSLNRQTGSYSETDLETAYSCLNRMRARSSKLIPGSHGADSFIHALDSAEGVEIFTSWEMGDTEEVRAIVKNLKDNWQQDTKYINAPNGKGFIVGNTVTWKRLNLRWLIVQQDYNFKDFFKGEMFKATHFLSWKDDNGTVVKQWASIRGPVETKAKYDNVSGNYLGGRQNDTIEVFIGANDHEAIKSLRRYDKIKVGTRTWKVQVRDDISNQNIIRLSCIENFNNEYTDDVVNAIPDGMTDFPENVIPAEDNIVIVGSSTIKEGFTKSYIAKIDETIVEGDFKAYLNGVQISEAFNTGQITVKGGSIGDTILIEFYQSGILKAKVEIPVVSMFS